MDDIYTTKNNTTRGHGVTPKRETDIIDFLTERMDTFAWEHDDTMGSSLDMNIHKLNDDNSNHIHVKWKSNRIEIINCKADNTNSEGT